MVDYREFEADTLEEAIRQAAASLGVDPDRVHYRLLDEGARGIFGLGARAVRIRVEAPAEAEAPEPPAPAPAPEPEPAPAPVEPPPEVRSEPPSGDTDRSFEEGFRRMLELMRLDLEVRIVAAGQGVRVELGGADRELMVQHDGELLHAVQFLVNRMSRRAWPGLGRVQLTCDGHRDRRDEDLVEEIREVAGQVARTGRAKRLQPMNPYERRLVHLTVREFPGLATRSEGDGFLKAVTVSRADSE